MNSDSDLDLENRVVAPDYSPEDAEVENPLRPRALSEYIGQQKAPPYTGRPAWSRWKIPCGRARFPNTSDSRR